MMKAGGHWSILGSILIAEEPADGKDRPLLDRIVTKAREHLMHFGDGGSGPVVGYGADSVDFKTAVSTAVAEAVAVQNTGRFTKNGAHAGKLFAFPSAAPLLA
eukprot:526446-Rhodomonas_salina.1